MFLDPIKHVLRVFFERLKNYSTKSVSLWTQSNGSNCERQGHTLFKAKKSRIFKDFPGPYFEIARTFF